MHYYVQHKHNDNKNKEKDMNENYCKRLFFTTTLYSSARGPLVSRSIDMELKIPPYLLITRQYTLPVRISAYFLLNCKTFVTLCLL